MDTQKFELRVDGVPYMVKATPFSFNFETRYTVSFNDSLELVFAYDPDRSQYAAIGDDAIRIPDNLEEAIARKLRSFSPVLAR